MEIEKLRQDLNDLLENVNTHSERFSNNRAIPSLEISFIMNKITKMHEKLAILKFLLEQKEQEDKARRKERAAEMVKEKVIVVEEQLTIETPEIIEAESEPELVEDVEEKEESKVIEPVAEERKVYQEVEEEVEEQPIVEVVEEEEQPTDEIVENMKEATRASSQKFKEMFTLNDRYLFANELFGKDMSKFSAFVAEIDGCISVADAKAKMDELIKSNGLDVEGESVMQFIELIERRFL